MTKARFLSSALDGQTVTMSATQGGVTVGPNTISAWKQPDNTWSGVGPATLTLDVQEILPSQGTFAPYPVEWRIRVASGLSYSTPDWAPAFADPYHTSLGAGDEDTIRLNIEAYDPSYQRCHFVVHTGDTGNYRNDWVGSQAHRDKSKEYGQNPGHVYSEPDTYTGRSVYVYDDEGNWGTFDLPKLVVESPDTAFDADSTIVVSPTSDWTDAPSHDVANRCTTFDAASSRFAAIKNSVTAGVRICVQSGSSYTERAREFDSRDAKGPCLVDTYGGSAQFTYSERDLDVPATGKNLFRVNSYPSWAWRIKNGKFDMGYDIVQGRPTNTDGWLGGSNTHSRSFLECSFPASIYDSPTTPQPVKGDPAARIVFDNLDITGCGWFAIITLVSREVLGRQVAMFANNCEFYGNPEYAFMTPENLFCLGTKVRALESGDLGAMGRSMAMGTSRGWTGHPIFLREQLAWTVYVRACYIESRGGWSGHSSKTAYRGGQAIMRLNNRGIGEVEFDAEAGWIGGRGRRYFFADSVITGYFGMDVDGDIRLREPGFEESIGGAHSVIENCLIFVDPMIGSNEGLILDFGPRHSIRNCIFVGTNDPEYWLDQMPGRDVSRFDFGDNRFGRIGQFIANDTQGTFKNGARVENRHNTFVMLRTTARLKNPGEAFAIRGDPNKGIPFDEAQQEMVEGHNILYAPNFDTPVGPAMDIVDLPAGMRILNPWIRFTWESKRFVLASDVPDGAETPAVEYPIDWYTNATTGADYAGSANTNSVENTDIKNARWFEPPADYPKANGRQTVPGKNADMMTVIHDCNSAGLVQGDGSGTHFKVLNRSGETWVAGNYRAILDRGSTGMTPETPATSGSALQEVDQSDFKLYRPKTPQPLDGGLGSTLWDFNRALRPGAGYAISPTSGVNAAGALLPE